MVLTSKILSEKKSKSRGLRPLPKITIIIFQVQLAMGKSLQTESSNLNGKARTKQFWAEIGPRSASEFFRRMFGSKRRDSESSTDIYRQNRRLAMSSERGALVIGAPTHSRFTVFTQRPVTRGGRWPGVRYKNNRPLVWTKQTSKFLDPSRMAKKSFFSGLGGYR